MKTVTFLACPCADAAERPADSSITAKQAAIA
jgi:hypothetical protein